MCPAVNAWEWVAPVGGGNWSAPADWLVNGATVGAAPAQQYPGQVGFTNTDKVYFDTGAAGNCTLDVAINSINNLVFSPAPGNNAWSGILTLNKPLTVSGLGGLFSLNDNSTISLTTGNDLTLNSLTPPNANYNDWSGGTITGAGNFVVKSSNLTIDGAPGELGSSLSIQSGGEVDLLNMTNNLDLTGTNNAIVVHSLGILSLAQQITTAGTENTVGGITLDPAHTGKVAVTLAIDTGSNSGGTLSRSSTNLAGINNQVTIAGAVYNDGGSVYVASPLKITGVDASGNSYAQGGGAAAQLTVNSGGNISAAGKYEIGQGTVQLTAGATPIDELDGTGLIFDNTLATALKIVDATAGTPGTVTVQGPVTLAANTTTTMNFNGTNNTADLLDVQNGTLTLAGALKLNSSDHTTKLTQVRNFFDDAGAGASIAGTFASITDDLGGTDTGAKVTQNANLIYYQVTMT